MGRVKGKGDAIQQSKSPPKMTDELLNCIERGRALWTVVLFRIFMQCLYASRFGLAFTLRTVQKGSRDRKILNDGEKLKKYIIEPFLCVYSDLQTAVLPPAGNPAAISSVPFRPEIACEIAEKALKDMHHPAHISYSSFICSRLWISENKGTV